MSHTTNLQSINQQILTYTREREDTIRTYIELMELVSNDIEKKDTEAIESHARTEEGLVSRLESLQRTIVALRKERNSREIGATEAETEERFRSLCRTALQKNSGNREKMRLEMGSIKNEMARLRRLKARTGTYRPQPRSRYVDIEG
ncbi:MAG: hypothetical protein SVR04_16955 [Spirochaetota bacterium]|nr:hypothetical protein [Spirochaetota bacterium]